MSVPGAFKNLPGAVKIATLADLEKMHKANPKLQARVSLCKNPAKGSGDRVWLCNRPCCILAKNMTDYIFDKNVRGYMELGENIAPKDAVCDACRIVFGSMRYQDDGIVGAV